MDIRYVGEYCELTLNRPPHNFLNIDFLREINAALSEINSQIVFVRSALKNFSAGANFRQGGVGNSGDLTRFKEDTSAFYDEAKRLISTDKILISVISGWAVGAGLGLALASDLRIAYPDARFRANFSQIGLYPGFGISVALPLIVGSQVAYRILLTGGEISADEALRIGLVDYLITDEDLYSFAPIKLLITASTRVLHMLKFNLRARHLQKISEAMDKEIALQAQLIQDPDTINRLGKL